MSEVKYIAEQDFQEEVLNSQIPVLVDFTASWCQPCKMLAPIVEDLAGQWDGKIKILKVDVDQNQGAAMQYSVMSIPTLIFFKGGEVKDRMVGFAPKDKIESKFAPHF